MKFIIIDEAGNVTKKQLYKLKNHLRKIIKSLEKNKKNIMVGFK